MNNIRRFNESNISDNLEDIKVAFLNISDENDVKFYYSKDIYNHYTDIFSQFGRYEMINQFLVVISVSKQITKDIRNPSELLEYYKFLEEESKIYKLMHESILKFENDGIRIVRNYTEILVCITLT